MRAVLLHLDDALLSQPRLRQAVCDGGGQLLNYCDLGPALRLWSRPPALDRLRQRLAAALPADFGPALVFSGSGDFHHITPLLLERALAAAGNPRVTVLHFDNHPDWVKFSPGSHCGSWVGQVCRLPQVERVLTVGVCSTDIARPKAKGADLHLIEADKLEIYAYATGGSGAVELCGRRWPTIQAMGEAAFTDFLPSRIGTEAVYVTIDKDVLRSEDAATNWDQGRTSLAFLKSLLASGLKNHRLIGADVVGDWSAPVYGGGALARAMKQAEALLDKPWAAPPRTRVAGNEGVNLALLDQFLVGAA